MSDPHVGPLAGPPYGQAQDQVDGAAASPYLSRPAPASYPAPGAFGDYSGTAVTGPPRTATLGWVALVVGLVSLLGSVVNALIVIALLTPERLAADQGGNAAALMAIALMNGLLVWFLLGLWAIVQGGVAIAQKRGLGQGLTAIVLGVIGPWTGILLAAVIFTQRFSGS